jgi:hypothetical protein
MSTEETETTSAAAEQTKAPAPATKATASSYGPIIKKAIIVLILLAVAFVVYKFVIQKKLAAMAAAKDETALLKMVSNRDAGAAVAKAAQSSIREANAI